MVPSLPSFYVWFGQRIKPESNLHYVCHRARYRDFEVPFGMEGDNIGKGILTKFMRNFYSKLALRCSERGCIILVHIHCPPLMVYQLSS